MFGPLATQPLPGRDEPLPGIPERHVVLGTAMHESSGEWPEGTELLYVGMGCFWGVERMFWQVPGVVTTAAGYMGGSTPNPTYREVCTGATGHAEIVLIAYDPAAVQVDALLKVFWENHDPTQGHRQGNDVGPQYRSAIYWTSEHQRAVAEATREVMQQQITAAGHGRITTEIAPASEAGRFYYAEPEHQQYLHKNPGGYCNHGPNGLTCPVGILRQDELPSQQSIAPPDGPAQA